MFMTTDKNSFIKDGWFVEGNLDTSKTHCHPSLSTPEPPGTVLRYLFWVALFIGLPGILFLFYLLISNLMAESSTGAARIGHGETLRGSMMIDTKKDENGLESV